MADMLKFRKGSYAKIMAQTPVKGTIYIAEDEKAMYVDIASGENGRIRIGDFIRVATVGDMAPPYSTSALYYVEADNALLKYVENKDQDGNGLGTYTWKQINGTDELKENIASVTSRVSDLELTVGDDKSGLVADVAALKTTVGNADAGLVKDVATNASDIANLKRAVGMGDNGEVEGIGATVAQLGEDLDALELEVHGTNGQGGMVSTLSDHESRIDTLEKVDVALKSDVTAAKTAVLGQVDGVDFNGTVKGAYDKAATAQTQADKGVADAKKAQDTADANALNISNHEERLTALDQAGTGKVAVLESRVHTLENAGYATVTQVNTAKSEVIGTEADKAGDVTVHGALKSAAAAQETANAANDAAAAAQGDINAWKEAHNKDYDNDTIDAKVKVAKDAADAAQKTIDDYDTAHKNDYTNAQIDANIKVVSDAVAENTSALSGLTGTGAGSVAEAKAAADAAQTDATKALADAAAAKAQADKGVSDAAAAKSAADAAQATANANADSIAELQDVIGTAKKGTGDGTEGNDAATGLYKVIEDSDKAIQTALESKIAQEINAANTMEFKGEVKTSNDLTAIEAGSVKVGDTYVVTGQITGKNYNIGDLLIASGSEENGVITGEITWVHVITGYDPSLDQKLTGADNKIKLSTSIGGEGTAVEFVAEGSASVSVANDKVTIGMVWDEF